MAFQGYPVLGLLVLLGLLTNVIADSPKFDVSSINRTSFPSDFIFGTASSAYQVIQSQSPLLICIIVFFSNVLRCQEYDQYYYVHMSVLSNFQYEGAAHEDGREPSIWDTLTHEHPGLFLVNF